MLAATGSAAFDDKDWIFEIKWDGYRAIADLRKHDLLLYSRNGISFLEKYQDISAGLSLQQHKMILDGEIVAYNAAGMPDFQLLQQFDHNPSVPLGYQVFDLLWLNGHSTEKLPLLQRKELLKEALKETEHIRYCDHVPGNGIAFFEQLGKRQLEGMIAKHAGSIYLEGKRTEDWLKIKFVHTEEVIICGYTAPKGSRLHFGALILGKYRDQELVYCGHTGTGFNRQGLKELHKMLEPLKVTKCPFKKVPKTNAAVSWVKPQLVCEIRFSGITRDGIFRHPVFSRLREDKNAIEVNEKSNTMPAKKTSKPKPADTVIKLNRHELSLSNQDKLYFPADGITKGDVIDYYQSISAYILPYLKGRPLSLNRFPNGITADSFYQKDAGDHIPDWLETKKIYSESTDKDIDYIVCNNKAALAYLNNLGCIDFNPWHSVAGKLEYPDYLVLDLDPSEKNDFDEVIEVALQIKDICDRAEISAYCKTSGSSGIHIYIPMGRKYSYEQVKDFAHILMVQVNEQLPSLTTLERSLGKRSKKQIYLDYLQNRQGQTIASIYSLRPKEGAPVSMPLAWDELKKGLRPIDFNIHNALERIESAGDLFKPVLGRGINMKKVLEYLQGSV